MWVTRLSKLTLRRRGPSAWALSLALLAASAAACFALSPWFEGLPFLTFYPAILLSTLVCGWRHGVLVLTLSALLAWYFHLPAEPSLLLPNPHMLVQLFAFVWVGALIVLLVAALVEVIRLLDIAVRRLDKAIQVQEGLFRELQHRFANNMQIVAAMLQSSRGNIRDIAAQEMLDHAVSRITSMAQLNRRLYSKSTYENGLQPILQDVLAETFDDLPVDVRLDMRADNLSLDQMTVILLLVNEAAINAAKHVFIPERGRLFEVSLREVADGQLQLVVRDDGPGIGRTASVAARATRATMGMTIMRAFASQLGSSLEVLEGPGTTLRVQFARDDLQPGRSLAA